HEAQKGTREEAAVAADDVVGRPDDPERSRGVEALPAGQPRATQVEARGARARLRREGLLAERAAALVGNEGAQSEQLLFPKLDPGQATGAGRDGPDSRRRLARRARGNCLEAVRHERLVVPDGCRQQGAVASGTGLLKEHVEAPPERKPRLVRLVRLRLDDDE